MVDNIQKTEAAVGKLEAWMHAHPAATKVIAGLSLVAIGFILGKLL